MAREFSAEGTFVSSNAAIVQFPSRTSRACELLKLSSAQKIGSQRSSSLEAKLAELRAGSKIPEDKRALMAQATKDLRDSGVLDHTIKVGDSLPDFSLVNANGVEVHSADLLDQGPLVVTVFRGVW